jgi:hypothetical protein
MVTLKVPVVIKALGLEIPGIAHYRIGGSAADESVLNPLEIVI